MATGDSSIVEGGEVVLQTSGALVNDGAFAECTSAVLNDTTNANKTFTNFELDIAGFSGTPGIGSSVNLYEQKTNSDAADAPDVDANNRNDYIGNFRVKADSGAQYLRIERIVTNLRGGKYWIEWVDVTGSVSMSSGWVLRAFPATYAPAA